MNKWFTVMATRASGCVRLMATYVARRAGHCQLPNCDIKCVGALPIDQFYIKTPSV